MHLSPILRHLRIVTILIPILVLTGCFGEGDGPQKILATPVPPTTGIFVDSPVSGAAWQTSGGESGLTNDLGEFMYVPGEIVTFSVGGIVLGSAKGARIVSAVELTGSNNPTDKAAVNQFVFLQSIDEDQDPDNGISISSSTTGAAAGLTLDFSDPDFPNAVAAVVAAIAPGNMVVSDIDALAHFYSTYAALGGSDAFSFSFPGFPPVRSGVTYELVFADEFDTGTVPNPEVWNYDIGYGDFGWGNNEWQRYTDSTDNVRVEDGNLVIQARCDTPPCGVRDDTVTSGRITTQDKFEFRYGTVIARIKPPVGDGAWPAFWSLGANFPEIGWPRSGEIDFMEMHNAFPSTSERSTHFTMHWCDETIQTDPSALCFPQSEGWVFFTQQRDFAESLGDDFHLFEADWDQNRIIGRIDGITYFERTIEPGTMEEFLKEFFLILNVAMGGTLGSDNQPPNGNEVWPQTMLVDYVRVYQRTDAPTPQLFIDFEDAPNTYNFNDFEGGVGDVVINPAQEGINTSAQVGRMQKFAATSMVTFGGSTLATAFDVPANSAFTMKVWSSRPVDVTFKLEGNPLAEVVASHGGGSMWEELRFDFGDFTTTATGITLIFDDGVLGDAGGDAEAWTFYFDDIGRVDVLSQIDLPITFDDPGVDYTLTDFGDPVAAATTLVADPDDADNTVASTTKPAQAPDSAGTTMSTTAGLGSAIPFTATETTIGVRVYSPAAGVPVRLKADNVVNGDVSVEAELLTTVANAWQTLVFDFSDQVEGTAALDLGTSYTALSIFFDFGTEGNGATYLWDDVEFGVSLPDTTAPTLLEVSISSRNSITSLATTGDEVIVELTADESIAAPTVTIGDVAAEVEGGGASWVASRTLTEADPDPDGAISFSIEFVDLAGNAGTPVSATTDSSSVTLDTTAPTLSILGAPTVPQTTLDPIVLTFQFSEPVTGFTLNDIERMNGSASLFTVIDGDTYTARFVPIGAEDLIVTVAPGAAADAVGLATEVAVSVTIDIELDADAPLLSVVSISSSGNAGFARAGDTVTIAMTANEDIAEPVVTIAGDGVMVDGGGANWTASRVMLDTDTEGEIGFVIDFEDTDGNPGPTTTGTTDDTIVVFDITAPTLTITGVPNPIQTVEPVTVTFGFDEDVTGFDVGDIEVVNGSADDFAIVDARTYTAGIMAESSGDLTVSVAVDAATDLAGNGNEAASANVTVDLSPFWNEVWSDEFTGTTLDATNWTRRTDADCLAIPIPCTGLQSYRTDRVSVGADRLTIEARDDVARGGAIYTSGLIDTLGRQEMKHGRIEVDVKLPAGATGIRPSLWMLPVNDAYGPWPQSGEIDILNAPNGVPFEHSLRYGLPEPEDTTATGPSAVPGIATTQFLTYALEWEAGEIRWFVDGIHVATQIPANWYAYFENEDGVYTLGTGSAPFDQDFYLLLSLAVDAVGGTYPQTLQVEAVRMFRCDNAVDPDAGTGCAGLADPVLDLDPVVVNAPFNGVPFIDELQVYETGPATLDFVDDEGAMTQGVLVPATLGAVTSDTAADDMGNTVWSVVINGVGGVVMGPADLAPATAFFDLSGSEAAGELLFRMRVNSVTSNPQLKIGLDSDGGSGTEQLTFAADGVWRNYSVKINKLLENSVNAGTSLDLANIVNLFTLEAAGGTVDLDLDDISVKVACRDDDGCEATPRLGAVAAVEEYSQNFEPPGVDILDPDALSSDGYVVFATVFGPDGTTFLYQYGTFPAPNIAGPAFSSVTDGQGGTPQGAQQLSIYNDYNNMDHTNGSGNRIEASVFRQRNVTAADLGKTITFSFDAKIGNLEGATTANATIKTLNPMTGFNLTNCLQVDTTNIPDVWQRYTIALPVAADDNGLVGQLIQFGFSSTASNSEGSAVFYDNLLIEIGAGDAVGEDCLP